MQKRSLSLLAIAPALVWRAEAQNYNSNFFPLLCCSNRAYTNAVVKIVTPVAAPVMVTIFCDDFHERISITNLPKELQTRYSLEAQMELEKQTAVDRLKRALGLAQTIRLIKALPDRCVQIEAEGAIAAAYIHNLPPDITELMAEINKTEGACAAAQTAAANAAARVPRGPPSTAYTARNQFVQATATLINSAAAEDRARAEEARASATEALAKANSRLSELQARFEARRKITARPTDFLIRGEIRQWEYQSMAPDPLLNQ